MTDRLVTHYGVFVVGYLFLYTNFSYGLSFLFDFPFVFFIFIFLGVLIGCLFGFLRTKTILTHLQQKNEYRFQKTTLLYLSITIILASIVFFYIQTTQITYLQAYVNFLHSSLMSFLLTRLLLFIRWENYNKKIILNKNLFTSHIYTQPKQQTTLT